MRGVSSHIRKQGFSYFSGDIEVERGFRVCFKIPESHIQRHIKNRLPNQSIADSLGSFFIIRQIYA